MKKLLEFAVPAMLGVLLSACGGGNSDTTDASAQTVGGITKAWTGVWQQLPNPNYAPPNGPYGRVWTEMTWDSLRQQMVVFGGNGATGYENDIWAYNAETTNWTVIDPQVFCPGNDGFSKVNGTDDSNFKYDPVNNLYWVFGAASGYRCLSYAAVRTAAAGSTTTSIVDPSLASTVSGAYAQWRIRFGNDDVGVAAYNGATKVLTLSSALAGFGPGSVFQLYATTGAGFWYYDPVTRIWVGQNTPTGSTGPTPAGARIAPAVAYSDVAKAFVLFGGTATGTIDKQVWRLDVLTKQWTQLPLPPSGTPPHMREMLNSFVYDRKNDVFILFGGVCSYDSQCPDYTTTSDTWAYKLSTNRWTKLKTKVAPPARAQQVMAYDDQNGVVVMFGGVTQTGVANDTWVFDYASSSWTKLAPATSPSPRYLAQIAHDPVKKRTVMFGGQTAQGMTAEIWALTLTRAAKPK